VCRIDDSVCEKNMFVRTEIREVHAVAVLDEKWRMPNKLSKQTHISRVNEFFDNFSRSKNTMTVMNR
jgi:hypothetical protein